MLHLCYDVWLRKAGDVEVQDWSAPQSIAMEKGFAAAFDKLPPINGPTSRLVPGSSARNNQFTRAFGPHLRVRRRRVCLKAVHRTSNLPLPFPNIMPLSLYDLTRCYRCCQNVHMTAKHRHVVARAHGHKGMRAQGVQLRARVPRFF